MRVVSGGADAPPGAREGAQLGEPEILLALGNLYADDFGDTEAAETAYRAGIAAGDMHCHNHLGSLL